MYDVSENQVNQSKPEKIEKPKRVECKAVEKNQIKIYKLKYYILRRSIIGRTKPKNKRFTKKQLIEICYYLEGKTVEELKTIYKNVIGD